MCRNLIFRYTLELIFSDDVRGHDFTLRMIPHSDNRQQITQCIVSVTPECEIFMDSDTLGNKYVFGNIEESHSSFKVEVNGNAIIDSDGVNETQDSELVYGYPSKYTRPGNTIKAYYDMSSKIDGESEISYATRTMHRLFQDIKYVKGVTDIDTTAEMALEQRKGVCQDYAHIMIALLRMAGIGARYVVGMMMGEGFSHAWVEACIDGKWIGFDPTNGKMVDDTYIKISNGRDYQDCIVNRGVFYGNVTQKQNILVAVSEV